MTSRFQNINGLRLHYLDYGGADKPALVCLHGLSGNAHNFDYLAPHLISRFHVLALDVRGRGDSGWGPPADYNPAVYVRDLAALVDVLGFPRVALIGTSMGGIISMMFAGGYPDRVARLVLNDIGPEVDPAGLKRIADYMETAPESFANLGEVIAYYRANYAALADAPEKELGEFVQWSVRPRADGRLGWKLDPAIRNPPRSGSAGRPMDLWVHYNRITAPILVVRGSDSDILARGTAERMRVVQRRTTVVEVPGVGHAPSLNEPEALAAIAQFLS